MSRGSTFIQTGWETLLEEHGIEATYTPAVGAAVVLTVLDNGQPEDIQQLAMSVDGIARIITATRTAITATVGDSVTIGATTYSVLAVRPRSDFAVDLLLGATVTAGNQTADTATVYFGASESAILNAAAIQALSGNRVSATPAGSYVFTITEAPERYLYFAWPDSFTDQPATADGFESGGFVMTGDIAGTSEGFTNTENGWNYALVTISAVSYRLYRTKYSQDSSVTVNVNT